MNHRDAQSPCLAPSFHPSLLSLVFLSIAPPCLFVCFFYIPIIIAPTTVPTPARHGCEETGNKKTTRHTTVDTWQFHDCTATPTRNNGDYAPCVPTLGGADGQWPNGKPSNGTVPADKPPVEPPTTVAPLGAKIGFAAPAPHCLPPPDARPAGRVEVDRRQAKQQPAGAPVCCGTLRPRGSRTGSVRPKPAWVPKNGPNWENLIPLPVNQRFATHFLVRTGFSSCPAVCKGLF